jgi:hypothetical protein
MARRFSVGESATGADVTRYSGFAGDVIADNVIAVLPAAARLGSNNSDVLITFTSRVPKHGSTIATGNESIAAGERKAA